MVDVNNKNPNNTKAGDRFVRILSGMIGSIARPSARMNSGRKTMAVAPRAMTVFEVTGQWDDVTRDEATMNDVICRNAPQSATAPDTALSVALTQVIKVKQPAQSTLASFSIAVLSDFGIGTCTFHIIKLKDSKMNGIWRLKA